MPFSTDQLKKTEKIPLQAQNKTGSGSMQDGAGSFRTRGKRASASAFFGGVKGSMTVEAALLMSFFLLAVSLLFYFFFLIEFQVELQFAMERKVHEAAARRPESPPGIQLLQRSVRQELLEEGKGIAPGNGGVRLVQNKEEGFLDVTAVFEAGPAVNMFGPLRGTYVRRCRRRLWTGQESIRGAGGQEAESEQDYVYITQKGTVSHRNRDCSYLRPSVHPESFSSLPDLRSADGSRYYPCERCIRGPDNRQTVYITDYGNRYHGSRGCGSLNRWVIKIPAEEASGRPFCSKCKGG